MVKPFLELKTYKKIKSTYSDQPQSTKVMESLFDMDKLESAFGGKSKEGFDYQAYAKRMKNEEKQKSNAKNSGDALPSDHMSITFEIQDSNFLIWDNSSVVSEDSTYNFDVGSGLDGHGTVAA
ncbi:UNVERIFIED_CONTAM: hypothetical protein Slati_1309400 [Sesamum latifolium]|uniref:Uncharacterized protein n=1 Tax=Sesamum latifolium TaxID=2727402 RepID=A0AAW2XH75_9LAMI